MKLIITNPGEYILCYQYKHTDKIMVYLVLPHCDILDKCLDLEEERERGKKETIIKIQ